MLVQDFLCRILLVADFAREIYGISMHRFFAFITMSLQIKLNSGFVVTQTTSKCGVIDIFSFLMYSFLVSPEIAHCCRKKMHRFSPDLMSQWKLSLSACVDLMW